MPLSNRFNKFILFQTCFASQAELIIVHRSNHLLGSLAKEKFQVHHFTPQRARYALEAAKLQKNFRGKLLSLIF